MLPKGRVGWREKERWGPSVDNISYIVDLC